MMYLVNLVWKFMLKSSLSKIIGYLLMSYNNSNEVMVQRLLVYPMLPKMLTFSKKERHELASYYKDAMYKILINIWSKEILLFVLYAQIIIDDVIFNTLQLIPKVIAKMLTTKKENANSWHTDKLIYGRSYSKEEYDENVSKFINPIKRVNWINRIIEIQKLITIYKIRSLKLRSLIKIALDETINLNTMEMRWHIPEKFLHIKGMKIINDTKKIINDYIYEKLSYKLNNVIEYIDSAYTKLDHGYTRATLKKVNGEYVITIKHLYQYKYEKYDIKKQKTIIRKIPTTEYYKYILTNKGFQLSFYSKMNNNYINKSVSLEELRKGILHEIPNDFIKYFCDIFIKGFQLIGVDIPYVKQFKNLEHYFKYPYISDNIYELRYFLYQNMHIDIDKFDNMNPSIMKSIWNKLNIPKSLRNKESNIIEMYLILDPIDVCNRIKYINYFYPKIKEINKNKLFQISHVSISELITILFIYKKSLLNDLERIENFLMNDKHISDTLNMLRTCVREYPEEVTGYLNRFKLEELHDQLTVELAKMRDKEIEIPYKYENIFKDQKIFDLMDGYEIRIPVCKKDLVILGNKLSICVGSSNYYSNMIKTHHGFIFMMYYKNEAYGCIQWEFNQIFQAMLEYNIPIKQKDEIAYSKLVEFTKKYAKEIHIKEA